MRKTSKRLFYWAVRLIWTGVLSGVVRRGGGAEGGRGSDGDPGSTRFFLSLEDNLFRIFGGVQDLSVTHLWGGGWGEWREGAVQT